jgi:hypothetical protein
MNRVLIVTALLSLNACLHVADSLEPTATAPSYRCTFDVVAASNGESPARQNGQIDGFLRDCRDRPIAGATVELLAPELASTRVSISDTRGYFSFSDMPTLRYTLRAWLAPPSQSHPDNEHQGILRVYAEAVGVIDHFQTKPTRLLIKVPLQ